MNAFQFYKAYTKANYNNSLVDKANYNDSKETYVTNTKDFFLTQKTGFSWLFVVLQMSTDSVLPSWSSTLNCCLECWARLPKNVA